MYTVLYINEAIKILLFKILTMGKSQRHKLGTGISHRVSKHTVPASKKKNWTANGK